MNPEIPQCEKAQVRSISREVDLSWLAGIIDGEGALSVRMTVAHNGKPYLDVKVRVYNTDVRMIQKISRIYVEMGVVFFYNVNKKRADHWKNQIGICVTSQGSCAKVLEAMLPYLANKADAAASMLAVIRFVQSCPKGGNTTRFDYGADPTLKALLEHWNSAKVAHIDPSTTLRRAGEILKIKSDLVCENERRQK